MAGRTRKRTKKPSKQVAPAAMALARALTGPKSRPRARAAPSRPRKNRAERISGPGAARTSKLSGSDFLGELKWDGTDTVAKRILLSPHLKPTMWSGTRLAQLAMNWQKFRFTRCRMQFNTALPSVVQAALLVYFAPDSSDDYSTVKTTADMLQVFASGYGAKRHAAARDFSQVLPVKVPGNQWYYTAGTPNGSDASDRFMSQGRVWIVLAGLPMGASGALGATTLGSVTMDWEVEFSMPDREILSLPAVPAPAPDEPDLVFHVRVGAQENGAFKAYRGLDVSVWGASTCTDASGNFNGWEWADIQVRTITAGQTKDQAVTYSYFQWWIDSQSQRYLDAADQYGELADRCAIRILTAYQKNQAADDGSVTITEGHAIILSVKAGTWRWEARSEGATRENPGGTSYQCNLMSVDSAGFLRDADQENAVPPEVAFQRLRLTA